MERYTWPNNLLQKKLPPDVTLPVSHFPLVGTLFIDTGGIYCYGTGLPISMSKYVYQYHHCQ